jgi:hypothetical protein
LVGGTSTEKGINESTMERKKERENRKVRRYVQLNLEGTGDRHVRVKVRTWKIRLSRL